MKLVARLSKFVKHIPERLEMKIAEWNWHFDLNDMQMLGGGGKPLYCALYNRDKATIAYLIHRIDFRGLDNFPWRIYHDPMYNHNRNYANSVKMLYACVSPKMKII